MKTFKLYILGVLITATIISFTVASFSITSYLLGWKPVVVPDDLFSLSVTEQVPTENLQPNTYVLTEWSTQPQRILVGSVIPDGNFFQIETNPDQTGEIVTYSFGNKIYAEKFAVPIIGLLIYPFTNITSAIFIALLVIGLLIFYRWKYFAKYIPPVEQKVDNIGLLQNTFDNAPSLTKKEARKILK